MKDMLEPLYKYCDNHTTIQNETLLDIERKTHLQTLAPRMLSGHLQGSFLSLLSKMLAPKYILEIGTFTGYSAICLAQGLRESGRLITVESDKAISEFALNSISIAGFEDKIELIHGDAKKIISDLDMMFDMVFIDADKESYSLYYDLVIDKCNSGAVIIADNVLWSGKVIEPKMDKQTKLLDEFNKKVYSDPRVECVILPIRDGLNVIRVI